MRIILYIEIRQRFTAHAKRRSITLLTVENVHFPEKTKTVWPEKGDERPNKGKKIGKKPEKKEITIPMVGVSFTVGSETALEEKRKISEGGKASVPDRPKKAQ